MKDSFASFPTIATNNLELKEVLEHDMQEFAEIIATKTAASWNNNPQEILQKNRAAFENKEGIVWGIYLENELIGLCGFYRGFKNNSGEIGYVLRKAFRKKGWMKEALTSVLLFGKNELKLKQIHAITASNNKNSCKLLSALQFKPTEEIAPNSTKFTRIL